MEIKNFKCTRKVVSVLFFQKPLKYKGFFANVESSFLNIEVISGNINSLGKFLLKTCSFQILAKYSLLISDVSFSILVGTVLYYPTFLLPRLLISPITSSDVISEN